MNVRSRNKIVRNAAWIGIIANLFLAIGKAFVAVIANSKALFADAAHSASDVVSSIVVLIGVRTADIPPDRDHPYGHGKAESIAAIVVAVILFIVGIEIAISSVRGISDISEAPGNLALVMVMVSIAIKEALFRYKINVGKKQRSQALVIDAWHHRSDALSSIAALTGIGLAIIGEQTGYVWLLKADALVGVFIALLIMHMAWMHGREAIHTAMDHVLHPEDTVELRRQASQVDGVLQVNELFAREHGHYVIVDIRITVESVLTVEEACKISNNVRNVLMKDDRVRDVFIGLNHEAD